MEQGSSLRPIINSATQVLSTTNVLRCTLYIDRSCCMIEHKRSAGPGEPRNDYLIVIDMECMPHFLIGVGIVTSQLLYRESPSLLLFFSGVWASWLEA
jgi:hypothetical protein